MGDIVLRYIGQVNATGEPSFMFGVPARDITQADIDGRGLDVDALLACGLYEAVVPEIDGEEDTDGDN